MYPKLQKVITKYILSANERDAIHADLNRLIALRDNAHKALKGASLKLNSVTPAEKPCLCWTAKSKC